MESFDGRERFVRQKIALLTRLFHAGVAVAKPEHCLPPHLPPPPVGRIVVIGAGKAAAAMARVVDRHYRHEAVSGCVVTARGYGHGPGAGPPRIDPSRIEVLEARHPLPDDQGAAAARRIMAQVAGLSADDLVICLISGGGSALLTLPAPGISLEDKIAVTATMLNAGAPISQINCVRKHLSGIKGGRLALACRPARLVTLIVSDVPGDDPADVASGPTVADPSTLAQARRALSKYVAAPPVGVVRHFGLEEAETPKPGDVDLQHARARIIVRADDALACVAREVEAAGYSPILLGGDLEGEAAMIASEHGALALDYAGRPGRWALISGGELTVSLGGATGRGGPNTEYLVALARALDGHPGTWAIAGDTDGADGSQDCAGAIIGPDSLARAKALGLDAGRVLAEHDAYGFFSRLGDLLVTGPTRTNVNDLRVILIDGI
ncbi:MAG: glycerate kinase [Sphingomonadales bacterium]